MTLKRISSVRGKRFVEVTIKNSFKTKFIVVIIKSNIKQ
jgi:hypothetical protein